MNLNDYQTEFNKLIAQQSFSSDSHPQRNDTFSKFLDSGIPTKKWEAWRHTDLSFLNKNNFRVSRPDDSQVDSIDISNYKIANTYTIIIINGYFIEGSSVLPKAVKSFNVYRQK